MGKFAYPLSGLSQFDYFLRDHQRITKKVGFDQPKYIEENYWWSHNNKITCLQVKECASLVSKKLMILGYQEFPVNI